MPPPGSGDLSAINTVRFRVMTFNIRHGRGMDNVVNVERVAEVINAEAPDLVALQEVDRGVKRSGQRDLPAELAELTGTRFFFDRNIGFEGGDYGNAVLTKWPIIHEVNTHFRMIRDDEQRGVVQVVVDVRGARVLCMNTHVDYRDDDTERLQNVAEVKEIVTRYANLPVVIAGDFNDVPGSRTYREIKRQFADAWEEVGQGEGLTFPADRPDRRIDYIWTSHAITPRIARVCETQASDHFPLVVDLEIDGRKSPEA